MLPLQWHRHRRHMQVQAHHPKHELELEVEHQSAPDTTHRFSGGATCDTCVVAMCYGETSRHVLNVPCHRHRLQQHQQPQDAMRLLMLSVCSPATSSRCLRPTSLPKEMSRCRCQVAPPPTPPMPFRRVVSITTATIALACTSALF